MHKSSLFTAAASAALAIAALSAPAQSQLQNAQPSASFLDRLFGNMFGTTDQAAEQTLESNWNQGSRPFEQRRSQLETRIDAAVRDGTLNRNNAGDMRRDYEDIVRLEAQYSANGPMQPSERNDSRSRYRALMQPVAYQNGGQNGGQSGGQNNNQSDSNDRRWQSIPDQNDMFEQRLNGMMRNGQINRATALRLRADWRSLGQIEAQYQRDGMTAREQADLWARYAVIDNRMGGMSGGGFGNDGNTQRWRQMETRLNAAQRAGRITAVQAAQTRAQIGDLERLDAAYGRGGYSAEQRSYLVRRYAQTDAALGNYRR